jgi:hypothetical protein
MAAQVMALKIGSETVVRPIRKRFKVPRTAEEYKIYKPRDGFKYEWVNGKLYKSNFTLLKIYSVLLLRRKHMI